MESNEDHAANIIRLRAAKKAPNPITTRICNTNNVSFNINETHFENTRKAFFSAKNTVYFSPTVIILPLSGEVLYVSRIEPATNKNF